VKLQVTPGFSRKCWLSTYLEVGDVLAWYLVLDELERRPVSWRVLLHVVGEVRHAGQFVKVTARQVLGAQNGRDTVELRAKLHGVLTVRQPDVTTQTRWSVTSKGPGSVTSKGPGSVTSKGPGSVTSKGPGSEVALNYRV